ncbi:hypothetical protein P3X46_023832 [Hevea brasiliensis]|uniref:CNNM transmembrane domain-containing protein n=1 Tax=Hevea brasiliensis TaxID=3981 RepID=A0ABQ9LFN9_HEVBR|nr:DUF21 domain-containing protein At5g52790 isoform X2 [Hevea brasiliensis]KAJ9164230.1 hypothetical protein P3X46_023832 [Hevea brasiliensis]
MAASDVPCCEPMFWTYLIICVALVCFAGLMSGLTLGLMSLSLVDLEVLIKAGQPQDRKNAEKILPLVKNQHLLLCTLLIGNALAMEALPIFLDALLPAWGAILISVTLILAFGEIIPQAVCSRYGLSVGARMSAIVRLIVIVLFPLAYPISKLLDWILGKKHSALLRRAELKTLVGMHGKEAGKGGELTQDETTIITGALDMTQKTAKDAMTPLPKIFSLDINSKLDEKTMGLIISTGHSRIPIYSGNPANIIGLILVKNLIKFRPEDETPIRETTIRKIPRVHDRLPLYDILNQFQIGHSHMAVVVKGKDDVKEIAEETKTNGSIFKTNNNPNSKQRKADMKGMIHQPGQNEQLNICIHSPSVYSSDTEIESPMPDNARDLTDLLHPKLKKNECQNQNLPIEDLESLSALDEEVIGIITLEDVMEELLQEEILDETDEYVDVHNKIKINMLDWRRSPLKRSPIAASASHIQWRTPVASPVSSYHQSPLPSCNHTPILHSPIPPYVCSPLARPTLSASPGKSVPNSPAAHYSPSSHRVSRKSYEKLRRPEDLY